MHFLCLLFSCLFFFAPINAHASVKNYVLKTANNDLYNKASLQRGATLYVNYCQACHSLQYVRYSQLRDYLGINLGDEQDSFSSPESISLSNKLIQENFNFVSDKVSDLMLNSMPTKAAEQWFGVAPPDLSLVARSRGVDWIYTYLKSFYPDESRPWGVNNHLFKDVAMPHVLAHLEKESSPLVYDEHTRDLVNFLAYVSEPFKLKRQYMGVFVLLFLCVLSIFFYLLKREYWKDI